MSAEDWIELPKPAKTAGQSPMPPGGALLSVRQTPPNGKRAQSWFLSVQFDDKLLVQLGWEDLGPHCLTYLRAQWGALPKLMLDEAPKGHPHGWALRKSKRGRYMRVTLTVLPPQFAELAIAQAPIALTVEKNRVVLHLPDGFYRAAAGKAKK